MVNKDEYLPIARFVPNIRVYM